MKISFVVLHYQNLTVTEQCISCLQTLNGIKKCNIIIVDNASPNNTGEEIQKKYENQSNIHILINKDNIGFAKGNNIGYLYAKNILNSQIIVVMNNDVLINQNDFIVKLLKHGNSTKIHLIAPDIINLQGFHQNPFRIIPITNKRLQKMYLYNCFLRIVYKVPIINYLLAYLLQYKQKMKNIRISNVESNMLNIVPHGSCIIYLNEWIKKEDLAFLPDTFMYFEEDILHEYAINKNYIIQYLSILKVHHIEDASINESMKSELKKRLFISTHLSKSIKILKEMRIIKNTR